MKHVAIACTLISSLALAPSVPVTFDVIYGWNVAALKAIRTNRTPPPTASRALAILHTSIFDAVNGIDGSYAQYFVPSAASPEASVEAAASAAARKVLVTLFPTHAGGFDGLHALIVGAIDDGPAKQQGLAWGESVATAILAWRSQDGFDAVVDLPSNTGPGAWQPTPPAFAPYLLPQWGHLTPFTIASAADVRPAGPPALDSARWADDYNEVKALGAAVGSTRTPDQSQIALFWADGAGTETPPGHWNSIARSVSESLGTPLAERARLFALLNAAMADAAICSWDAKYTFAFWRPVTAIRLGDTDGNDLTEADPAWSSFIITPPFPDYTSGHSTFSGAAATILAMFYGTDEVSFTATSDALVGATRTFTSFSDAAAEAALSRLYGGIHYRSANEDGLRAGIAIGAFAFGNVMQPTGNRARR